MGKIVYKVTKVERIKKAKTQVVFFFELPQRFGATDNLEDV